MIEELFVRGVGGIKEAKLSFNGDFIVITGESGAGKSSLVRAIEFISGKRAQTNMIHSLEESCYISMSLSSRNENVTASLPEIYKPQDGLIIVERSFSKLGKGKTAIQGFSTSINMLSNLMERKVVIQSQFSQLDLIDPSKQIELLDSFGSDLLKKTAGELYHIFNETIRIEKDLLNLRKKRREIENKYQDYENILREIKPLNLQINSEDTWHKELLDLQNTYEYNISIREISQKLLGSPSNDGVLDELEKLSKRTYTLVTGNKSIHECIEKILFSTQELTKKLNEATLSDLELKKIEDTQGLLEDNIGSLRKLKRMLVVPDCKGILNYAKKAMEDLEWLRKSNKTLEELAAQVEKHKRDITIKALALRALRKESGNLLSIAVNKNLKEMAMEYANFGVTVDGHDKVRATGADKVSFTLALKNQEPLPVAKNASGGELSRILISLQLALGDSNLPDTLVFDEVEAGLGGRTALLAGYKLKELSKKCRTILITHEATIAAMADQHFLVKRVGEDTRIEEIRELKREREIARMLAGDENSEEALKHAAALLYNT